VNRLLRSVAIGFSCLLCLCLINLNAFFQIAHATVRETTNSKKATLSPNPVRNPQASAAAFQSIIPVLRNPRCLNCHSRGDFPRQDDDNHPHSMDVRRGPDGHGANPVKCSTCHQDHNLAGQHMPPGAPDWHLPSPGEPMIWEGLTDQQLCKLILDPNQNGNRSPEQIVEHMHTPLVLWGWNPGEGRTPVAMSSEHFLAQVKLWISQGAACPKQ
jgi:hypothetical protein